MELNETTNCTKCYFYRKYQNKNYGICCKQPPQIITFTQHLSNDIPQTRWPEVDHTDICGEFKTNSNC